MKRILPALLVALAAFASACQTTPPNTNTNANTNTIVNANNGNGNVNVNGSDRELRRTNNEKKVEIYLTNSNTPGKCDIEVDPKKQTLDSGKHKVRWVAYNDCDAAVDAKLVIGDFSSNSAGHSPFGDDPYDNRFTFDPIAKDEEGRLISKTGKKPGLYEYTLKIVGTRNADLGSLDPQIEIGAR